MYFIVVVYPKYVCRFFNVETQMAVEHEVMFSCIPFISDGTPTNVDQQPNLGKSVSTKTDEFPENFRKGGVGAGVISDPKDFIAIF